MQTYRKGIDVVKGRNDWYEGIAKRISELNNNLGEKVYKKYKLDLLLCMAQRVAEFSSECTQCQAFRQDITTLARNAGDEVQMSDRKSRKAYFKSINSIVDHLQRQHKLVTEGYYLAIGMVLGSGMGVALGAAMDNIGSGVPIGVGVGIAIGVALDAKAKKEGRVICPRETGGSILHPRKTARFSKTAVALLVVAGLLVLGCILAIILFRRHT